MALVEVQLNRLGINSLELSTDQVDVSVGTTLHVRIVNYGAPTHATLRTEGSAYTNFTYENLYVEAESEIKIDILPTASPGSFDMQVISGYGMRRAAFSVQVILAEPEKIAVPVEEEPETGAACPFKTNAAAAVLTAIMPVLGLIFLLVWVFVLPAANTVLMAVILFAIMLAGIIVAWRLAH
jgi:hypothetical protein